MAPNPRIRKAFYAMKQIGIPEAKVKPVLKKLLKLYDKNLELIEMDDYRVLADAIFEEQEAEEIQEKKGKKKNVEPENDVEEEEEASIEPEQPLKRYHRRGGPSSPSHNSSLVPDGSLLKKPKVENEEMIPLPLHVHSPSKQSMAIHATNPETRSLIAPKDEPFTDDMPLDVIRPELSEFSVGETSVQEPITLGVETENKISDDAQPSSHDKSSDHELATILTETPAIEIASSPLGEVKVYLSCSPTNEGQSLRLPSLEQLNRSMEEKCLRSYKILDPNFNAINLMNDMCSCFLELARKASNQSPERLKYIMPNLDVLKSSAAREAAFGGGVEETIHMASSSSNGKILDGCAEKHSEVNGVAERNGEKSNREID